MHLVLAGVPVVQQACRDEEGVVLVAALAVVPAAVVADLGLPSGVSDGALAACGGSRKILLSACERPVVVYCPPTCPSPSPNNR